MLDRTVAPAFRQIDHISIKQPEKFTVSNGVDLYAIVAGTQPVIKLELVFDAGKWLEDKPGISYFAGKMLREGAGKWGSFEISNMFESYGAHLEITPTFDFTTITIYCLTRYLDKLLPIVRSIISEPSFPEEELVTLKNIQIQTLRVNNEKNSFIASRKLRESLFGSSHPYGYILEESDINSVIREDLLNHFGHTIYRKPFTIIASGLINETSRDQIIKTFSDLKIESIDNIPDYEPALDLTEVIIDKEESSQSAIRLGCWTLPMSHPEYPGLLIANEILGGYFGSRLMKNIREEKGLTYGIYSSISTLKHGSFFSVSADIKKEFKDQVFEEIELEIKRLRTEPVSLEELETVRNYMLGQIQSSISTPFSLASKFKTIYFNGLDYEYYSSLIDAIRTVKAEQLMDLSSRYLQEDKMVQVRVG